MKPSLSLILVATLLFIFGSTAVARAEKALIVPQEGVPLKVLLYTAEFDVNDKKPLTEHEVKYQNVGEAKIVSVRFGFLEFNGYGDLIDTFCGYTLEESKKGEKDSATFIDLAEHSPFFEDVGEAYLWIDAIRYEDSTLWKVDRAQLLSEVQKLKSELTAADLVEKKCVVAD